MNRTITPILITAFLSVCSGCQSSQNRTAEGAVIGGVLGAAAGGIIGHQDHHAGEGVAIGAAAGALTGALIGSQVKKPAQRATPQPQGSSGGQQAQSPNPNQIPLQQIISLSKQGVNEYVIIDKIRLTNSKYNLSAADVELLKKEGVSSKVIEVMQAQ